MRRIFSLFGLLLLAGCSTAPLADFLDWVSPGGARPGQFGEGAGNRLPPVIPPTQIPADPLKEGPPRFEVPAPKNPDLPKFEPNPNPGGLFPPPPEPVPGSK